MIAPHDPGPDQATSQADIVERAESFGLELTPILDQVEAKLAVQVATSSAFVEEAARYLMAAGGKRFRPMLAAIAAHYGDPTDPRVADAGVLVELIHLATLYHDDVIDDATARRGTPSANLKWDNTVAILTGDYLFARASELSADLGVEVTRIVARTIATLCEGQIREVQGTRGALPPDVPQLEPTLAHYLSVVGDKTAVLTDAAARIGAMMAGLTGEDVAALARCGWDVGMAFQLSDDLLDVTSDHAQSGKTPGTDLKEGVRTLPVLFALEADPDGELARLLDTDQVSDDAVTRALELLRGSEALERARAETQRYASSAVAALDRFGDQPATRALTALATYTVSRTG